MSCISCLCALALPDALRPVSRYSLARSVCIVHNRAIATRRAADSLPHCPALHSCNPHMRTCKQDGRYGRGFYIVRFATIVRTGIGEGVGLIAFIDPTGKIGGRACSFHWRHTREGGPDAAGHNPKAAVNLSHGDTHPQAPGIVLSYPPDTMIHCRLRVGRQPAGFRDHRRCLSADLASSNEPHDCVGLSSELILAQCWGPGRDNTAILKRKIPRSESFCRLHFQRDETGRRVPVETTALCSLCQSWTDRPESRGLRVPIRCPNHGPLGRNHWAARPTCSGGVGAIRLGRRLRPGQLDAWHEMPTLRTPDPVGLPPR